MGCDYHRATRVSQVTGVQRAKSHRRARKLVVTHKMSLVQVDGEIRPVSNLHAQRVPLLSGRVME